MSRRAVVSLKVSIWLVDGEEKKKFEMEENDGKRTKNA